MPGHIRPLLLSLKHVDVVALYRFCHQVLLENVGTDNNQVELRASRLGI